MLMQTPFIQALTEIKQGTLKTPHVSVGSKQVDYIAFQLNNHIFALKILSKGMTMRGVKLKDIRTYYGLKAKTASMCLVALETLKEAYLNNEL